MSTKKKRWFSLGHRARVSSVNIALINESEKVLHIDKENNFCGDTKKQNTIPLGTMSNLMQNLKSSGES